MPPKKMQSPRDGFSLYVEELAATRGKSPDEVFESAGSLWEKLPIEAKEIYNSRASDTGEDLTKKYTSQGVPIATINNLQMERQEKETVMLCYIRSLVGKLNIETTFLTQTFFLCHVNFFYRDENTGDFKPAEIAISEFSLKEGIIRTYHRFIDPGKCALGYRYSVKTWAERSHRIPFQDPDWTLGEKDYSLLYMEIKYFLMGDKDTEVVVYTMPDSTNHNTSTSAIVSTFKTLQEHAGAEDDVIKVYSLPVLYYEMLKKLMVGAGKDASMLAVPTAAAILERDTSSCSRYLACDFHEEMDLSAHCSLSLVKRWVFYICDLCLKYTKISTIPGKHCLRDSKVLTNHNPDDSGFFEVKKKHFSKVKDRGGYQASVESRPKSKEEKLRDSKPITITFGDSAKTEVYPPPMDVRPSSSGGYAGVLKGNAPPPTFSSDFPQLNGARGIPRETPKEQHKLNPSAPPWLPRSSQAWPSANKNSSKK